MDPPPEAQHGVTIYPCTQVVLLKSDNYDPKTRAATYMTGRNVMKVNYQQSLDFGPILRVRLICECDLHAEV